MSLGAGYAASVASTSSSHSSPDPNGRFWAPEDVPAAGDDSFSPLLSRRESADYPFVPADQCEWHAPTNPKTYHSFGDNGLTATVNAFGEVIHMNKYLGVGRSGVFAVDHHSSVSEPYLVLSRANDLQALVDRKGKLSYGLQWAIPVSGSDPTVNYVQHRWPRFKYERDNVGYTVQWMVHNDVLLQQCTFQNLSDNEVVVDVSFEQKMRIRDQEYFDISYSFNDSDIDYSCSDGPNGYGWVLVHKLPKLASEDESTNNQARQEMGVPQTMNESPGTQEMPQANGVDQNKTSVTDVQPIPSDGITESKPAPPSPLVSQEGGIAVIASVFVDGSPVPLGKERAWPVRLERRLDTKQITTAYRILHIPQSTADWRQFMISTGDADVTEFLRQSSETFFKLPISVVSSLKVKDELGQGESVQYQFGPPIPAPSGVLVEHSAQHIEFAIRRHLEHILSVCAIPIEAPCTDAGTQEAEDNDIVAVALTCGDMSGHRVISSASFFAFTFLTKVAMKLKQVQSDDAGLQSLLQRIHLTLAGHMKWLKSKAELSGDKHNIGCYVANYWPTGKAMPRAQSWSWKPEDSPLDTAFHLAKAHDLSTFGVPKYQKLAQDVLTRTSISWLTHLEKLDKRHVFAWPHARDEDINMFRLDDHVWIWRALKAIEDSGIMRPKADEPSLVDSERLAKLFNAGDVQREILRRFTTENDVSRKRMLAVTRSSRETRFLFHARDTALFYGLEWDFFLQQTSFTEVWENTIETQIHYDENQETSWDNAIRYALALVIGSREHRLNKRSPTELVRHALEVLFRSTGPNGFFPGQLDKATKEPTLFYNEADRDFYYHASFEIPFILLTHAEAINLIYEEKPTKFNQAGKASVNSRPATLERLLSELDVLKQKLAQGNLEEVSQRLTSQPKWQHAAVDLERPVMGLTGSDLSALEYDGITLDDIRRIRGDQTRAAANATRKGLAMKKIVPFNSQIDSSSIIDIEEEWLYNYPSFLLKDNKMTAEEVAKSALELSQVEDNDATGVVLREGAWLYLEAATSTHQPDSAALTQPAYQLPQPPLPQTAVPPAMIEYGSLYMQQQNQKKDESPVFSAAMNNLVIDTPKQKHAGKREKRNEEDDDELPVFISNIKLWDILNGPRTAEDAKKRFIWLPDANTETALVCYLAAVDEAKPALTLFFERHANYEKYFFDDTTTVLNTWESEFHLSFYQVVDRGAVRRTDKPGIPKANEDNLPSNHTKMITRASMGFHFTGDIFDRYWTCHFIEYVPAKTRAVKWDFPFHHARKHGPWRQRKVLELHLFERILNTMVKSTQQIFDEVRAELGVRRGAVSFSVLNSDDYFSSSAQWQKFQQLLQAVEEELATVLVAISKWETRDRDRGQEKPRWTRNDERKYRGVISKLEGSTGRKIRDLHSLYANIKSLKETLISSQDQIRDDLGLRGAENIRFFTYVTVVFLPLGFASSVYSMNGSPDDDLLKSMVIFAVVALLLTVIALVNAKTLASVVEEVSFFVHQYSRAKMRGSLLIQKQREREEAKRERRAEEEANASKHPSIRPQVDAARRRKTPKIDSSWHLGFWLAYVLIELPARRVLLGYRAVKAHQLSWTAVVHIAVGIILLPIFLISWSIQLIIYNLIDLARLMWDWLSLVFATSPPSEDDHYKSRMALLTYPPESYRPLRSLDDELRRKKQQSEKHEDGLERSKGLHSTGRLEVTKEKDTVSDV